MHKKLLFVLLALCLSSSFCLAQAKKPVPASIARRKAELTRRLAGLHRGTPLKVAVQKIASLGGTEDGGLQPIPATRYYFEPGVLVELPLKNKVLTGPVKVAVGSQHFD